MLNKLLERCRKADNTGSNKQPALANAKVTVKMKITRADGSVEYKEADGFIENKDKPANRQEDK